MYELACMLFLTLKSKTFIHHKTTAMTKINQLDFTGSTIFCGLDVHKNGLLQNADKNVKKITSETYICSNGEAVVVLCSSVIL